MTTSTYVPMIDYIASCDDRYVGHTPDGMIVIEEDKTRSIISQIEYEFLAEPSSDECVFALINILRDTNAGRLLTQEEVSAYIESIDEWFRRFRDEQGRANKALFKMLMHLKKGASE